MTAEGGGDDTATTPTTQSYPQQQQQQQQERTTKAIETLMAEHDPILLFASKLLPPPKAADASALYAWCRRLDEICDNEDDADNVDLVRDKLDIWQARFEALWRTNDAEDENENKPSSATTATTTPTAAYFEDDHLMDLALKNCIEKYQGKESSDDKNNTMNLLTRTPFDDMIEGMKSDAVEERRIQNMEELELYAYQVAGTVGMMLLPLLLSSETSDGNYQENREHQKTTLLAIEEAREPAICLGKAIQLVNILRDATQDAKLGRIYLPRDMLRDEGVDDTSILAAAASEEGQAPNGYTKVVQRVSIRALELLAVAERGKTTLPPPLGPLFVQIIVELYRDYLDELNRRGYDNLRRSNGEDRVKISTLRKLQASLRAVTKVGRELYF